MTSVTLGVFLSTIDGSIVNVALPVLARSLQAPFEAVQWVVLAYLITLVSLMMVAGRLADMWGKRNLYTCGFLVFTLGSLLCSLAPSVGWLVAARVVQAVGAAVLMALGGAIAAEAFPPTERGRAMGVIGMMVSVGLVSGPTLGGFILGTLSWRAIFYVNLPIGVLGTVVAAWVIPQCAPSKKEPFDAAGALLLCVGLVSTSLAITLGPTGAIGWVPLAFLGSAAVFCTVAFIVHERRYAYPLLDLSLFSNRTFSVQVITATLTFVAAAGLVLLLPFYLQNLQGRSVQETGALLIVTPIAMGITSPIAGRLSDRWGPRPLAILGLSLIVLGYLTASTLTLSSSVVGYIAKVAPIGLGMGIFQSPNNSAILGAAPAHRLGVASGLVSLSRTFGQTLGIAILGALWAATVLWLAPGGLSDATQAPLSIQLQAFQYVARASALLILGALLLVLFG